MLSFSFIKETEFCQEYDKIYLIEVRAFTSTSSLLLWCGRDANHNLVLSLEVFSKPNRLATIINRLYFLNNQKKQQQQQLK